MTARAKILSLGETDAGVDEVRACGSGLTSARDEFRLAVTVQNLKTLALRLLHPPPKPAAV